MLPMSLVGEVGIPRTARARRDGGCCATLSTLFFVPVMFTFCNATSKVRRMNAIAPTFTTLPRALPCSAGKHVLGLACCSSRLSAATRAQQKTAANPAALSQRLARVNQPAVAADGVRFAHAAGGKPGRGSPQPSTRGYR